MKKIQHNILIVSSFPPGLNFPGSKRVQSWCDNFHKVGLFPIVFTVSSTGNSWHKCYSTYEVHAFEGPKPYLRQMIDKGLNSEFKFIRKASAFLNGFFCNYLSFSELKFLLSEHCKLMARKAQVIFIVATAPSYVVFSIARAYSKHLNVPWIADYRDDWTTSELYGGILGFLQRKDRWLERGLLKSACFFVTISPWYVEKIRTLVNIPGYVVENGFDATDPLQLAELPPIYSSGKVIFLYPGKIYKSQEIVFLCNLLRSMDSELRKHVCVIFLGSDVDLDLFRKEAKSLLDSTVILLPAVSENHAHSYMSSADAFIYIAHRKAFGEIIKGMPSSKLYNYIKYRRLVALVPSDADIAFHKLTETGQAVCVKKPADLNTLVESLLDYKRVNGFPLTIEVPSSIYYSNSRESRALYFAEIVKNAADSKF